MNSEDITILKVLSEFRLKYVTMKIENNIPHIIPS